MCSRVPSYSISSRDDARCASTFPVPRSTRLLCGRDGRFRSEVQFSSVQRRFLCDTASSATHRRSQTHRRSTSATHRDPPTLCTRSELPVPTRKIATAAAEAEQRNRTPMSGAICDTWLAPDYSFIGVLRTAPGCTKRTNHFACDGRCMQPGAAGMAGDDSHLTIRERGCVLPHIELATIDVATRCRVRLWTCCAADGCWFYTVSNASGNSRAVVNVGRSLRVPSRCWVSRLLGIEPNRSADDQLCVHEDRLWCDRARVLGFDSIQVLRGTYAASTHSSAARGAHSHTAAHTPACRTRYYGARHERRAFGELVVCVDACVRTAFAHSACVPVARRLLDVPVAMHAARRPRDGTLRADDERRGRHEDGGEVAEDVGRALLAPCDCPAGALSLTCDGKTRVPPAPPSHAPGASSLVVETDRGGHGAGGGAMMNQTACAAAFRWLDALPDRFKTGQMSGERLAASAQCQRNATYHPCVTQPNCRMSGHVGIPSRRQPIDETR